jgi:type VI secretion system protein ImpM
VADSFRDVWDAWLQHGLHNSRLELGADWLDYYLTSPLWRFFLSDGVAGPTSHAGVLLPSVDRVGRYFPLTVVVELPVGLEPIGFATLASDWFGEIERLCTSVVSESELSLEAFDAAVAESAGRLFDVDRQPDAQGVRGAAAQWRWPLASPQALPAVLAGALIGGAQATLRPLTLWWTTGSEHVEPSVLLVRALPRADSFAALLAGRWDDGRWDGLLTREAAPQEAMTDALGVETSTDRRRPELEIESAGASDMGSVRSENQDAYLLNDGNRLWAIADGLGGHQHGGMASQMVVDALNALAPSTSLNAALQSVDEALGRVNADLRRGALGLRDAGGSASTIVALMIRGHEWAVQWAGDSRAYRYREAALQRLTSDHSAEAAGGELVALVVPARGEITRAIGGEDQLELDVTSDVLADGDRFLLCSDGLYDALDEGAIARCLEMGGSASEVSTRLIERACAAGARDNVTAVVIDVRQRAAERG